MSEELDDLLDDVTNFTRKNPRGCVIGFLIFILIVVAIALGLFLRAQYFS